MGDPSVCYPWEYEDEVFTGIFTPHCHPGSHDDSLLCFFRLSYCLWYDSLEQLGHWHWDEIMAGFRACGVVVMVLWFLEFARARHDCTRSDHSLPEPVDPPEPVEPVEEVPEPAAAAVDEDRPELPAVEGRGQSCQRRRWRRLCQSWQRRRWRRLELAAAAVDEDRPESELAAALDEERPVPELAAVEERPVPELLCSAPPGREDRLTLTIQALTRSVDNLAVAFNGMRRASVAPGSVAPGSVVPWRASGTPSSAKEAAEMQGVWTVPGEARSGSQQDPWAAVPGLERDSAGRFLPRTPAKREPAGDESDALDMAEEFNIDDLLASPVSAEKKPKKRRKNPLPLAVA